MSIERIIEDWADPMNWVRLRKIDSALEISKAWQAGVFDLYDRIQASDHTLPAKKISDLVRKHARDALFQIYSDRVVPAHVTLLTGTDRSDSEVVDIDFGKWSRTIASPKSITSHGRSVFDMILEPTLIFQTEDGKMWNALAGNTRLKFEPKSSSVSESVNVDRIVRRVINEIKKGRYY